jgi:ABC-type multidrug transport system fused ATPase/permease subunit
MRILRLYARVLELLGPQIRLGWALALANVALATAQFAEPVLFGRIIDSLAGAQGAGGSLSWAHLVPLVAAWVGFGLFMIVCGALVALYADRLAHRRRQAVLSEFFEHALRLPLSFHSATHSGRVMKVMLSGTDTLWWLWLGFFREDLAALISIFVLVPMSLCLNWRLALLLIGLCVIFVALTAWVLGRTEALQKSVERYYSDLAERASDTLGNVALVQSFTRVEAEVRDLRNVVDRLLGAQMPVLSWWALANTLTKTSTTLTHARDPHCRTGPFLARADDCRRNRHVHDICRHAHSEARTGHQIHQSHFHGCSPARRILRGSRHYRWRARSQKCGDSEEGPRFGRL